MSETPNPIAHDQNPVPQTGPVSQYMERVLASPETAQLNGEQFKQTVSDHLVGSIMRVMGREEGYNQVWNISHASEGPAIGDNGEKLPWVRSVTRADGLRRSIVDIMQA